MEILDREHERSIGGRELDGSPPGGVEPGAVAHLGLPGADGCHEQVAVASRIRIAQALQPLLSGGAQALRRDVVREAEEPQEEPAHRPIGETLAVGQALCDRDDRVGCDLGESIEELLEQAGFPGAGRRDDAHQVGPSLAERASSDELELCDVVVAADDRRSPPVADQGRAEKQCARNGGGLASDPRRGGRSERKSAADGAEGSLRDDDLPRISALLEPRRSVDRIASDEEVCAGARVAARHDFTAGDAKPDRQAIGEDWVVADLVSQLEGGKECAVWIVAWPSSFTSALPISVLPE